jgi:hypothetical protein
VEEETVLKELLGDVIKKFEHVAPISGFSIIELTLCC